MKYKVGDEVLVKLKVKEIDETTTEYPIAVCANDGASFWPSIETIVDPVKQFPREMWVWDEGQPKMKKQVSFIHPDNLVKHPVLVCYIYEDGSLENEWFQFADEIEPVSLTIEEAKQIIAKAKGVDVSEVNIEVK